MLFTIQPTAHALADLDFLGITIFSSALSTVACAITSLMGATPFVASMPLVMRITTSALRLRALLQQVIINATIEDEPVLFDNDAI